MNLKTSTLIFVIVVAIIAVVNYLVGSLRMFDARIDFTEKKLFTLSDGTRKIIKELSPDKPVTVRFYATRDNRLMPQWFQGFATTVEDLLLEFEKASDGKITLEKIDPRPSTDDEDKARADDIQGHVVNQETGDKVYFGLAIQCLGQKEVLASIDPADEAALEYKVARALSKVTKSKRTSVGVMSAMPLAGPVMSQEMMQMMRQQRPQPWVVIQQLRQDYALREVPMTSDKIDSDINILLIIHPGEITEKTEFAIDQFLLKGGKVIAFVDPQCLVSQQYNNQGQMGVSAPSFTPPSSNLPTLFKAWGIGYSGDKVVADMTYATRMQGPRGLAVPTFLTINKDGINKNEPVASSLEMIQMFSPGAFNVEKKDGISAVTLLESSENSALVDNATAEKSRREALNDFHPDGRKRTLALRLNGKFKTAFPDGPPKLKSPVENAPKVPGAEDKDASATKSKDSKSDEPKIDSIKESQNSEGIVFLFADADMLFDAFCFEQSPVGMSYRNSNAPLLLNIVEMLSGGADLIAVRSRGATKRPFTKMQELSDNVEALYRPRIQQLTDKLNDAVQQISNLKVRQDKNGQMVIVDPEQKKKLDEAMSTQTRINKEIREIRKEQNRDKDRTEMWITAANFLVVPLLLIAFGVTLAMRRRNLRAAH